MSFNFLLCLSFYCLINNLITCQDIKVVSHTLSEKEKTEALGIALTAMGMTSDLNSIATAMTIELSAQFGSHWNVFITTDKSKTSLKFEVNI